MEQTTPTQPTQSSGYISVSFQTFFEAIMGGLASSIIMDAKALMMIAADFKPGFRIDLQ